MLTYFLDVTLFLFFCFFSNCDLGCISSKLWSLLSSLFSGDFSWEFNPCQCWLRYGMWWRWMTMTTVQTAHWHWIRLRRMWDDSEPWFNTFWRGAETSLLRCCSFAFYSKNNELISNISCHTPKHKHMLCHFQAFWCETAKETLFVAECIFIICELQLCCLS